MGIFIRLSQLHHASFSTYNSKHNKFVYFLWLESIEFEFSYQKNVALFRIDFGNGPTPSELYSLTVSYDVLVIVTKVSYSYACLCTIN